MPDKFSIGFVGCGRIAVNELVPQAAAVEEFTLRAFMDVGAEPAQAACEQFGGAYHTTELDRLLGDDELDAVIICTLPDTHAQIGAACLDAGKHAFIQKPAAITYDGCRRLIRAERASRAKAMVAYCYRLSPLMAEVHKAIPHPRLMYGRMMSPQLETSHGHYLTNPALAGGGPMLELACHNVDMLYWLARSRPVRVSAAGGNLDHPGVDLIDNFAMTVEFESGAVAVLLSGECGGKDFSRKWYAEVFGDATTAIIDGFGALHFAGARAESIDYEYKTGIGLDRDMAVWRDVLTGKIECPCTATDGVIATLLMLKAYESLESGKPEPIDLDEYLK